MFVCEKCHRGDQFKDCWLCELIPGSYGKCEVCQKVKGCSDCHSYGSTRAARKDAQR